MSDMKVYAIIVAGGAGNRMNSAVPKQFLMLGGKPLIYYTVATFLQTYPGLQVVLVLPAAFLSDADRMLAGLDHERIQVVAGGDSRFLSVKNGLQQVPKNMDSIVLVHDGVRCMVTMQLIRKCCEEALKHGNAIPAVKATDSIRILRADKNESIDRNQVYIIQTPQAFQSAVILHAFEKEDSPSFTDEASVVEADGIDIHLVEGEYQNIKVTRPVDLTIVERMLEGK
ncbi:MAG: 2-C-methyl-D-erythritol 4-phosphate cytidylyltransferase [Chitinophagaceae bacterium]